MATIKWFDRKFNFHFGMERFPVFLKCLTESPSKYLSIVNSLPEPKLNFKPEGKWSIKEHIGHLWVLEPLWQKRLLEIKEKRPEMSPADLNNTATNKAVFNQYNIKKIMNDFMRERSKTITLLNNFKGDDFTHSLYHPRLQQPMRIIDLMHFVTEHDTHHLNSIQNIINLFSESHNINF